MSSERPSDSTLDRAARQILRSYPSRCQPRALIFLNSGGGFSGARLWRVEGPGGLYALRAMPSATVNLARLHGLHRLLRHVADQRLGAIVAVPLSTIEGGTYLVRDGHVWQVEPWLPGAADFAAHRSPLRLRNALRVLAQWHVAARSFVPAATEATWFASTPSAPSPGLAERFQRLRAWSPEKVAAVRELLRHRSWPDFDDLGMHILDLIPRAVPYALGQLQLGSAVSVPLQPCLRDVWHDHVLFSGDEVSGLIDAHSCRADCVATDLARLLGSLVADDRQAWETGLEAYNEERPLNLEERTLVEIFDQSAILLNGLTWLEWRCLEHRTFDNPRSVVERLREIVSRLESMSRR